MLNHLNHLGQHNLEKNLTFIYSIILKYAKSPDGALSDKIKFILKDAALSETPLTAICNINIISMARPKAMDLGASSKKPAKKAPANQKYIHEFDYFDKSPFLPFFSENNCKVICFALNFERVIRYNIFECFHKLFKIDDIDKEVYLHNLEENYKNNFVTPFIKELSEKYKKEIITFDIDLTPPQQ